MWTPTSIIATSNDILEECILWGNESTFGDGHDYEVTVVVIMEEGMNGG